MAFDDKAHVLATCLAPDNFESLYSAIKKLDDVGGGGTAMGQGLQAVRQILASSPDPHRTRKLILLTDGERISQSGPQRGSRARRDFSVPIVALGTRRMQGLISQGHCPDDPGRLLQPHSAPKRMLTSSFIGC